MKAIHSASNSQAAAALPPLNVLLLSPPASEGTTYPLPLAKLSAKTRYFVSLSVSLKMMSKHTLLSLFAIAYAGVASAQTPASTSLEPLASKHFTWPNIPFQVTGDQGGERGPQFGFNQCNSTTENQQSNCQVSFLSHARPVATMCWSS